MKIHPKVHIYHFNHFFEKFIRTEIPGLFSADVRGALQTVAQKDGWSVERVKYKYTRVC